MIELIGESPATILAKENLAVRNLVKIVQDANTNERQLMFMIYQLSLQLENIELMKDLTSVIKEYKESVFITGKVIDE
jgi:hypothetical protein